MLLGMPHGPSKRGIPHSRHLSGKPGATGLGVRHGTPAGYEDLLVTVRVFIDLYYQVLLDPGRSFAIKACR
jgi:hypothetical protein